MRGLTVFLLIYSSVMYVCSCGKSLTRCCMAVITQLCTCAADGRVRLVAVFRKFIAQLCTCAAAGGVRLGQGGGADGGAQPARCGRLAEGVLQGPARAPPHQGPLPALRRLPQ